MGGQETGVVLQTVDEMRLRVYVSEEKERGYCNQAYERW